MDQTNPRDPHAQPSLNPDDAPTQWAPRSDADEAHPDDVPTQWAPQGGADEAHADDAPTQWAPRSDAGETHVDDGPAEAFSEYQTRYDPNPYTDSTDFAAQSPGEGWPDADPRQAGPQLEEGVAEDLGEPGEERTGDTGAKVNTGLMVAVSIAGTALAIIIGYLLFSNAGDPTPEPSNPPPTSTQKDAPPPPPPAPPAPVTVTETPAPRGEAPPPQIIVIPEHGGNSNAPAPVAPPAPAPPVTPNAPHAPETPPAPPTTTTTTTTKTSTPSSSPSEEDLR